MGYSHHFRQTKPHTGTQWDKFIKECKKLHKNLPKYSDSAGGYYRHEELVICGGDGTGEPTFNEVMVDFNGNESLSHETFRIMSDPKLNKPDYCKTARKPYDLLVVAVLISAARNINYKFSSDGDDEDLSSGLKYYNEVIKPRTPAKIKNT